MFLYRSFRSKDFGRNPWKPDQARLPALSPPEAPTFAVGLGVMKLYERYDI